MTATKLEKNFKGGGEAIIYTPEPKEVSRHKCELSALSEITLYMFVFTLNRYLMTNS